MGNAYFDRDDDDEYVEGCDGDTEDDSEELICEACDSYILDTFENCDECEDMLCPGCQWPAVAPSGEPVVLCATCMRAIVRRLGKPTE